MPISYKNKIYTTLGTPTNLSGDVTSVTNSVGVPAKDYTVKGKSIVWNQLMDKSKFEANKTSGGVTFTNNGNGSVTVNGTATADAEYFLIGPSDKFGVVGHKYFLCGCPSRGSYNTYRISSSIELNGTWKDGFSDDGTAGGNISRALSSGEIIHIEIAVKSGYTANNLVFKPQLFDLTEMFGAGNEPSTPAEFSVMFHDDYYPYNAGELKSVAPTSVEASGIERFQLLDKSKYSATTTISGVTFTNNGDGTITANGTATSRAVFYLCDSTNSVMIRGKGFIVGDPEVGNAFINYDLYDGNKWIADNVSYGGKGTIFTGRKEATHGVVYIAIEAGTSANNLIFKPQLFDLTQMFGAGNEPATPAEFWQRVPDKLYGYNPNDYKSANIPSSKYFLDGMRSAGSAYDEINFLSQKAIKRIGVRTYQTGDENNTAVMTDKKNTVYALASPVETAITPSLQTLFTYKGFTSFSAPNSLTQNGPLSVTYYAEGGANPESGWLTSYKRKLYMGKNIEWNQLLNKSGFYTTRTINGVTFTNNGDGTVTANGTATANADFRVSATTYKILANHKCLIVGGVNENAMVLFSGDPTGVWLDKGNGVITNQTVDTTAYNFAIRVNSGTTVSNVVFKPQLFDLTQMFGAGKEPATPEEFWTYFDHKLYPYNTGETQPLFKISRKSQWGSVVNKGDLINIEGKQYRVLKTNGNVAEVLAMYNPSSTTQSFGTTQIYANSSADTYCNETFYNGLSSAMKSAIVEKTFTQDSWFRGSSGHSSAIEVYQGVSTDINYVMSLMNKSFGASITRKCYMISIQDIIDYIGATTAMTVETTTLKQENIWKLFWNQSTKPGTGAFYYPWLRSASTNDSTTVFDINSNTGRLDYDNSQNEYIIRPAFQIDLSKISWTPVQTVQAVYAGENTVIPQTVSD